MSNDEIRVAFVVEGDHQRICTISEIKKDDVFYLVINGARGDLMQATSSAQIKNNQWQVEGVPYE
jgi:hypothetical protein